MPDHSRLVRMRIVNIGCIGAEGVEIAMDNILCLVGPNNSGKSTVLRAYEAAVGSVDLTAEEICSFPGGGPSSVEIWVHIPQGMANIDEKWKEVEGNLRLVRGKWEWVQPGKPVRTTWDLIAGEYSSEEKASGIDAVFASRLPKPLRIHALQTPDGEHDALLKLVLDPVVKDLNVLLSQADSNLKKAVDAVTLAAHEPVAKYAAKVNAIKDKINKSYQRTFPLTQVELTVGLAPVDIRPLDLLLKGSKLELLEAGCKGGWKRQGTGSQRALFWSMLEARSELKKAADGIDFRKKKVVELDKAIKKLESESQKAKKQETKSAKDAEVAKLVMERTKWTDETADEVEDDLVLPGYMLLIDEPEIALHPNAVRSAKTHLYQLARESGWQIMLSTHHPAFIDPLEDHTTIVRLVRTAAHPTPKIYRSDLIEFDADEKENLKMLLRFDQSVAEMFFGAFPIIVEGDTEYAAFTQVMANDPETYPEENRPLIIRARG